MVFDLIFFTKINYWKSKVSADNLETEKNSNSTILDPNHSQCPRTFNEDKRTHQQQVQPTPLSQNWQQPISMAMAACSYEREIKLQLFRSLCTQLKLNRRLFWWYSSGCTFRLNSEICERCRLPCVCMTLEMVVSRRCFKDAKRTKLLQPQSKNIPAYIGLEEVWELGLIILGKRDSAGSRERQKFVAFNALHFLVASWP